jgi:hypothetical protein
VFFQNLTLQNKRIALEDTLSSHYDSVQDRRRALEDTLSRTEGSVKNYAFSS